MSSHKVDVVIPTTGRSSLARAVSSVRAQEGVTATLHVVLDAPENYQALRAYLSDEEIILTRGGIGGAAARNAGLRASRNQYVAYLDDDDWWEAPKLRLQVEEAQRTGAAMILCGGWMEGVDRVREVPDVGPTGHLLGDYMLFRPRLRYGFGLVQSSCMLIDRNMLPQVMWDDQMPKHQDWDYAMRIEATGKSIGFVAAPLVHIQEGSANSISRSRSWRASRAWYERYEHRLSRRARGDFVATQALRAALANADISGITWALVRTVRNPPHLAALVVGGSGLAEFIRTGLPTFRRTVQRGT